MSCVFVAAEALLIIVSFLVPFLNFIVQRTPLAAIVYRLAYAATDRIELQSGEWILRAVEHPVREVIQKDGRIRRWAQIDEMDGRYLRVILLPDRETVHNAFFDRTFEP